MDSPGLEDKLGLEDSPEVEGLGRVEGGLSTGCVEVEAGRLKVEAPFQSVGWDRQPDVGQSSLWSWWSYWWRREQSLCWSFSGHINSRASSNSRPG